MQIFEYIWLAPGTRIPMFYVDSICVGTEFWYRKEIALNSVTNKYFLLIEFI